MRHSELKQLIKEEIRSVLNENLTFSNRKANIKNARQSQVYSRRVLRRMGALNSYNKQTNYDTKINTYLTPDVLKRYALVLKEELEELKDYIKRGFYIGLTGHCLHKLQPVELEAWMKEIPLDKLFIETDAPYMGFKGCRATEANKKNQRYPNVPAALPQILNAVAVAAKVPPPTLAAATIRNVKRFFPRAKLF